MKQEISLETKSPDLQIVQLPQCQFFVIRKKRLCRMTVKPGRQYCGEHEPQSPQSGTTGEEIDPRVPCPRDPKHTCYASKLEKHLQKCNANKKEVEPYIEHGINEPKDEEKTETVRRPLKEVPQEQVMRVIDKVNAIYEKHVKHMISTLEEQELHPAVLGAAQEVGRTQSSLRHLHQISSLMRIVEDQGLQEDGTCYVELGGGKGMLSYYMGVSWCTSRSTVLVVDRAALRHKRDNALRRGGGGGGEGASCAVRVRADLAHLALARVPAVARAPRLVALAKHLCGAATDLALRCVCAGSVADKARGLVLAPCCHHRCDGRSFVGATYLQEMGISSEELDIMFSVVSWATCGDGRGRQRPRRPAEGAAGAVARAAAGRATKAVLEWARARYLRSRGWRARLVYYVPPELSPENVCLVATRPQPPPPPPRTAPHEI